MRMFSVHRDAFRIKECAAIFSCIVIAALKDFIHMFLDYVWVGKTPCGKSALDGRYFSKVSHCTQSEEMPILCPFWDSVGSCGL